MPVIVPGESSHTSKNEENQHENINLFFVTSSKYKYDILKELLDIPLILHTTEIEEIQGSKEKITELKARKVSHLVNENTIVIVDDTSIHLDGLYGFPGQYARHFLEIGLDKVLDVAQKVGDGCVYSTIFGLAHIKDGKLVVKTFEGSVRGRIITEKKDKINVFSDIFEPSKEELELVSEKKIAGTKIGRYKAAKHLKEYLVNIGVYDKILQKINTN